MSSESSEDETFESQASRACDALALGLAGLVAQSEGRELLPSLANTAASLAARCREQDLPSAAALAAAIAQGCELLFEGQVDPGQAILLLASGTETLHKSIVALIASPKTSDAEQGLGAARYELETLFPIEGQTPKPNKGGPDVLLHRLRER